jgi:hypothetical protein
MKSSLRFRNLKPEHKTQIEKNKKKKRKKKDESLPDRPISGPSPFIPYRKQPYRFAFFYFFIPLYVHDISIRQELDHHANQIRLPARVCCERTGCQVSLLGSVPTNLAAWILGRSSPRFLWYK